MIDSIITWIKSNVWIWQAIMAMAAIITCYMKRHRLKEMISKFFNKKNNIDGKVIQASGDVIDNSQNKNEFNSHISDISGGSVVAQSASNLTIVNNNGLSTQDVMSLLDDLTASEIFKNQITEIAGRRYNELKDSFEPRLKSIEDKLNGFADPGMQFILHDAITEYIKYGSEDKGESLIDLLIERLEYNDNTSKRSLIDEAIRILPKLSQECVAILALLSYNNCTIISGTKNVLIQYIKCLNPILDKLSRECKMDILYLSQMNCILPLSAAHIERDLIKKSKKNYPLAFSKPIDVERSREFMQKYGISYTNSGMILYTDSQNKLTAQQFGYLCEIFSFNEDGTITPNLLNKDTYREVLLQKEYTEEMISNVETLLSNCNVASDKDIISFYDSINPKWSLAIKMLNDKPLNEYKLQPLGSYIGLCKIFKLAGKKISIDELLKIDI